MAAHAAGVTSVKLPKIGSVGAGFLGAGFALLLAVIVFGVLVFIGVLTVRPKRKPAAKGSVHSSDVCSLHLLAVIISSSISIRPSRNPRNIENGSHEPAVLLSHVTLQVMYNICGPDIVHGPLSPRIPGMEPSMCLCSMTNDIPTLFVILVLGALMELI